MLKRFLDQLTQSQKQAVTHVDGPLLVLAGPGSGKTRVITYRIAALIEAGIKPYNICAITFTNKAAAEMAGRAKSLCQTSALQISTFHSLCVRILRQYAASTGINSNFSIYDTADQKKAIKQSVKECDLDSTNFQPARMLNAISSLKNQMVTVKKFEQNACDYFSKSLAKIYANYQKILSSNNSMDFDDLIMKTAILLEENETVRKELSLRFKYLMIDEYQDTNNAQYNIAKLLASEHSNICATGDPDQSIYRWRGADIQNILRFETDYPNAKIVALEENFRSTPKILKIADDLICNNINRKQKKLIPTKPHAGQVTIDVAEDEFAEADFVATQVKQLQQKGTALRDIAVFYRVNAMSRSLEEMLIRNKIPYQIVRGVEFYSRKEIRDVIAYLKVLANPLDDLALLRIVNTPPRGIGKTTLEKVAQYTASRNESFYQGLKNAANIGSLSKAPKAKIAVFVEMIEALRKKAESEKIGELVEDIVQKSTMQTQLQNAGEDGANALENIGELVNSAYHYDDNTQEPSLIDYLQEISLFSDSDAYDENSQKVALMTLHAAKGLEFDNVFIVGLEDKVLPHERSLGSQEEIEEERRLFFVGITRAKKNLWISYSKYRTIYGQLARSMPSKFLYELGLEMPEKDNEFALIENFGDNFAKSFTNVTTFEPKKEPLFEAGQLVRHQKFGLGKVKQFLEMAEDSTVTVSFNTAGTKTLMLQYANLTKV